MADKDVPKLTVEDAGNIMHQFGYRAIIIVGIRDDGVIDVSSYGRTKADCRVIGDYAQNQFGNHLPIVPFQTWFGWGNGGTPVKVKRVEFQQASPQVQAYITCNTHPQADEA